MKVIGALCAMALCVSATPAQEGPVSSSMPPERFRKLGVVPVLFVPFHQLNEFCAVPREEGRTLLGCTRRLKSGQPIVIMPDPCPAGEGEFYARIMCHENAHALGGWSGNHEL